MMSMNALIGDNESIRNSKAQSLYLANDSTTRLQEYGRYLASGPGGRQNDIELTPLVSATDLSQPLLNQPYYDQPPRQPSPSSTSSYSYMRTPPTAMPPIMPPSTYYGAEGYQPAPVNQQYPPHSRQTSNYEMYNYNRTSSYGSYGQGNNSGWGYGRQ